MNFHQIVNKYFLCFYKPNDFNDFNDFNYFEISYFTSKQFEAQFHFVCNRDPKPLWKVWIFNEEEAVWKIHSSLRERTSYWKWCQIRLLLQYCSDYWVQLQVPSTTFQSVFCLLSNPFKNSSLIPIQLIRSVFCSILLVNLRSKCNMPAEHPPSLIRFE